jgi:hypothetical protein
MQIFLKILTSEVESSDIINIEQCESEHLAGQRGLSFLIPERRLIFAGKDS